MEIRFSLCFLFLFTSRLVFAQEVSKLPFYKNSVSLEFTHPIGYIKEFSNYPSFTYAPAIGLSAEIRIKNKFYGEFGFLPASEAVNFNSNFSHYAFYGGALMKFPLFKHSYFTPSVELYYMKNLLISPSYVFPKNEDYFGIGPTIGFEYFISKRFSVNTDIGCFSYGLKFDEFKQYEPAPNLSAYLQQHGSIAIFKTLSLGVHYNFNLGK